MIYEWEKRFGETYDDPALSNEERDRRVFASLKLRGVKPEEFTGKDREEYEAWLAANPDAPGKGG